MNESKGHTVLMNLDILESMVGLTITGQQLNQLLVGFPLLKFMNDNDQHFGMKYQTGKNENIEKFDNSGSCRPGGIYITTLRYFCLYERSYGKYARRVRIEDDAMVYVEHCGLKCDKIILEERCEKEKLIESLLYECIENGIIDTMLDPYIGNFVRFFECDKMKLKLIEHDHNLIRFFECTQITEEMILNKKIKDPSGIKYIDREAPIETIMNAINGNYGGMIVYLPEELRTEEVFKRAIEKDWTVMENLSKKYLTHELKMFAIKQDWRAIYYFDDPSIELIKEAEKQYPDISKLYIKKSNTDDSNPSLN